MLSELLHTLAAWLVILPSTFLAGTFFRRLVPPCDFLLRGILYYALGLAVLSYGVVVLSALHLLAAPFIWMMLFLLIFIRANKLGEWFRWLMELKRELWPAPSAVSRILFLLFVLSFVCLLMGMLTPEIGGDALTYQLNLPKRFLQQGSLLPDPFDFNSFFPLLANNLFLIGLATGGVVAAKAVHFFCGVLLFVSIFKSLRDRTKDRDLAFFCALVVWLTPAIYNLISTAYIDVVLALYTFLAVWIFIDAFNTERKAGFFVSGLLAGCGVAIKYISLISPIALAVVGIYYCCLQRCHRQIPRIVILFLGGFILACGFWLIRNWSVTGNPFFPYWGELFGAANRPATDFASRFGYGHSPFNFLSLFFNMFLDPRSFGTFATRIGIFYFLFLPFVFAGILLDRKRCGYGIFCLAFSSIIFFIAQADRWMLPVLPVMAVAGGIGMKQVGELITTGAGNFLRKVGVLILIGILCIYFLSGVYHYRYAYLLFTGRWDWTTYCRSLERTTDVAEWSNRNLPREAKILFDVENRLFYFDRPVIRQGFLSWKFQDAASLNDPPQAVDFLRRHGITHFLVSGPIREGKRISDYSPLGRTLLASGLLVEVYTGESKNIRDDRYYYRLFEIPKVKRIS